MSLVQKTEKRAWFYSYNMIFTMPISAHAKLLYLYLCRCADEDAKSFPSRKTIASACGFGLSSLGAAMRELIATRLLSREEQHRKDGSQTSNIYTIYPEPYEE